MQLEVAHRCVALPVLGLARVFAAWRRAGGSEREALRQPLLWQAAANAVLLLHLGLQGGIGLVAALLAVSGLGSEPERWIRLGLVALTVVNLGAGAVEWGLMVWAGFRAARGHPYPALGPSRR